MISVITFLLGGLGGFLIHALTMKVSFKQRTIENKIKVYDSLITHWVRMRNFIFSQSSPNPQNILQLDQIYGESQALIGEAFLITDNVNLAEDINNFNEKFYRANWTGMNIQQINDMMEKLKQEGIKLVTRMREDIQESTRFEMRDFLHIIGGFRRKKT